MGSLAYGRPSPSPTLSRAGAPARRRAGVLPTFLVITVIAALVGACAGPAPTTSPTASSTTGTTPRPSASASGNPPSTNPVTPAPSTTPGPTVWTAVDPGEAVDVADLQPTKSGRGGVAVDTAFRMTVLDGRAPADAAARLVSQPALTFTVASVEGTTALLRPTTALSPGVLYRISLTRGDGTVEATWAAMVARPLNVVESIPGDQATGVPVTTGIEVVFDQDGVDVADFRAHFTITPAVTGRFEAAGRTMAFIPARALAKGRVYTVTVTHGLPLAGTGQVLDEDRTFSFETAVASPAGVTARLRETFLEASTREQAAIEIYFDGPDHSSAPSAVPVTVHRLAGLSQAMDAWRAMRAAPEWTQVAGTAPVATEGLDQVIKASLRVRTVEDRFDWIQLPSRLSEGWYLVTVSLGVPRQAVLQVTDIATFTLLAIGKSAVWVNDLATKQAAVGATVEIDGDRLGATDSRGLLVATTPSAVLPSGSSTEERVVVVRHGSRSAFQPVSVEPYYCGSCGLPGESDDAWWQVFTSERSRYRPTDTVNAWGVVRNRDSGKVPPSVSVSLHPQDGWDASGTPISTVTATPDAVGAFAVRVELRDLPVGSYLLQLSAGGTGVGELWFEVATIVKPAYRLELTTARHAMLDGASVGTAVHAEFFGGTPVAGAELSLESGGTGAAKVRTDDHGDASGQVRVRLDPYEPGEDQEEQWAVIAVQASPTLPEEAAITAASDVAVFRSTAVIDALATRSGTTVSVTGKVSDVAFDRFNAASPADLWSVDPRGAGRAGVPVGLTFVQHTPVRTQVGTRYDFVTKQVTPVYEESDRVQTVASRTVRTAADGTFRATQTVAGGDRWYEVRAAYTDQGGRSAKTTALAETAESRYESRYASLVSADAAHESGQYSVGEEVLVQFVGGLANPPVASYFYAITQQGLTYATVGSKPRFLTTFTAASVPDIGISGVRFNGYGYDVAMHAWTAGLRTDDRRIGVEVTADRARYAPGETATVTVRTTGPDGKPIPASVYVNVVDEKLYAIGAAEQQDPLYGLYGGLGDGVIAWAASHRVPSGFEGDSTGGGDGDEDRGDFRDWILARLVTTGTDGRARVDVPLPDDLTSWHVSASAVDAAMQAGTGTGYLRVGLPFFVEATLAPQYLVADRPVIRVRGFGSGLRSGERVTFTVSSDTLRMSGVTATADAFETAEVPLPALSAGTHRIRVVATAGSGATLRRDALLRTIDVVATRTTRLETTWAALDGPTNVQAGSGLTRVTLVDAGRGRVVPILQGLAWTDGGRADRELAAALANRVLVEQFGLEAVTQTGEVGLERFLSNGVAIVPYGSVNLDVTALAAMSRDPRLDTGWLEEWFGEVVQDPDATRERRLLALAGLAGLGRVALDEVRAAAAVQDLTVPERISVAIAALFAGDEALARSIERDLLATHAMRLGSWVRLDPGRGADAAVQTARLAIVAASLGDPIAAEMDAWVDANPPKTTTVALERALAARGWALRVAGSPAVAAVTVDGARREVTIEPGKPASMVLTPAQAATARLEPVSGSVLAVTAWTGPLDPTALSPVKGQKLVRTVTPAGAIGPTDTVIVTLRVTLGPAARDECWRVTDLAPSGLAPISVGGKWWGTDEEERPLWTGASPDTVDGQRVEFCVSRDPRRAVQTLRYVARVVTPGTYLWEPALLQSTVVPEQGLMTRPVTVTIRGTAG